MILLAYGAREWKMGTHFHIPSFIKHNGGTLKSYFYWFHLLEPVLIFYHQSWSDNRIEKNTENIFTQWVDMTLPLHQLNKNFKWNSSDAAKVQMISFNSVNSKSRLHKENPWLLSTATSLDLIDVNRCWVSSGLMLCQAFTAAAFCCCLFNKRKAFLIGLQSGNWTGHSSLFV